MGRRTGSHGGDDDDGSERVHGPSVPGDVRPVLSARQ